MLNTKYNKYVCAIVFLVALYGCANSPIIEEDLPFEFKVFNATDMELRLVNKETGEKIDLKSGEFTDVESTHTIYSHTIEPVASTTKTIERKEEQFQGGGTYYKIVAYKDKLRYEVSGTASTVDITYRDYSGSTVQFTDVSLPHTITYDFVTSDFAYISAQNNGESGTVSVKVYYEDRFKDGATSAGAFVIATASAGLD
ncbi:hypothetical protein BKI52_17215 [marine bacterium AO1-C]|nr:hypothetical protein BKI52_17215 [marine bacterium AO1-C]